VTQVINMLNTDELMVLLVNELIMPRTFYVEPTQVMYVSGLGRIDYVQVFIFVQRWIYLGSINCTVLCINYQYHALSGVLLSS